jgi:hypothetical protein
MPLEVQVGDTLHTLAMADGTGELSVPEGSLMIVDPRSKVLREMPHVEAFQAWEKAQAAEKKAKEKAGKKN